MRNYILLNSKLKTVVANDLKAIIPTYKDWASSAPAEYGGEELQRIWNRTTPTGIEFLRELTLKLWQDNRRAEAILI